MKQIFSLFFLLAVVSCSNDFFTARYQYEENRITAQNPADEKLWKQILPYKDSLDKEMNIVLAVSDTVLTKSVPESDLGNLMCDLILKKSRDYSGQTVHFTFLNNGGIRIPNLPKGNITLGNIIELMPFENRLGLVQIKGVVLDTLFNHMAAKGGWQVSGARYKIRDGKAIEVTIAGMPLDLNKTYIIAASDYLLQGGDNSTMLQGVSYIDLKKTLRDALIEGLREMTAKGEHVRSVLDGRVHKIN